MQHRSLCVHSAAVTTVPGSGSKTNIFANLAPAKYVSNGTPHRLDVVSVAAGAIPPSAAESTDDGEVEGRVDAAHDVQCGFATHDLDAFVHGHDALCGILDAGRGGEGGGREPIAPIRSSSRRMDTGIEMGTPPSTSHAVRSRHAVRRGSHRRMHHSPFRRLASRRPPVPTACTRAFRTAT